MRYGSARSLAGIVLALGTLACYDEVLGPSDEIEEPFSYEFASQGITTLDLTGITGSIEVVGTTAGSPVMIQGFRRVRAESPEEATANLPKLTVDASLDGSSVVVRTRQPFDPGNVEFIVDYEVSLPADMDVLLDLVTGTTLIESLTGAVDTRTVTGTVVLNDAQGPTAVDLTTGTVTGSVTLTEGVSISVAVITGTVTLSVPDDAPGVLTASVVTGLLSLSGFSGADQDPRPNAVRIQLGDGDGSIDVSLVTGTVVLTGR